MVAAKSESASGPVHEAGSRLFLTMTGLVAEVIGALARDAALTARLTLVLSATIQGISSLVVSGRVPTEMADGLIDDAIRVFVAGALAKAP